MLPKSRDSHNLPLVATGTLTVASRVMPGLDDVVHRVIEIGGGDQPHGRLAAIGAEAAGHVRHVNSGQAADGAAAHRLQFALQPGELLHLLRLPVADDDVGVSFHQHAVESLAGRRPPFPHLFQPLQHVGRLHPMLARSDFLVHVGPFHAQFLEEDLGEVLVVVLTGVDEGGADVRVFFQRGGVAAP